MTKFKSLLDNLYIFIIFSFLLCFFTGNIFAQEKGDEKIAGDVCHVYVVDTAKALKLEDLFFESANPETDKKYLKLKNEAEKSFPEFQPTIGEEELTTQHYLFPKSNLIITASVFYTDDWGGDKILMGIVVSGKRVKSAIGYPPINGALAELSYNDKTDLVRVKQYVKVKGRIYLIGLECDCSAKGRNKK